MAPLFVSTDTPRIDASGSLILYRVGKKSRKRNMRAVVGVGPERVISKPSHSMDVVWRVHYADISC
jgi:hypothetical protein